MSARRWILLSLALMLWLGARTGVPESGAVQLRWIDADIQPHALTQAMALAEQPVRAAIWETKRVDGRSLAAYFGDPLLLTGDLMLHGNAARCAVSQAFALATWKSDDVVGLPFSLGGVDYMVGGVYASGVADVLMAGDGASGITYRQMALRFPNQPGGAQLAKALDFASRLGMSAPDEVLDAPLLTDLASAIARIPGWVLVLLLVGYQWKALRGLPIRLPLIALSLLGMAFAMGAPLAPPRWLLPSRWSDFAHWRILFGELGDRLVGYLSAAHNPLNSQVLLDCLRASGCAILSAMFLLDIRGGNHHDQNMDRAGADLRAMLWWKRIIRLGRTRAGGDARAVRRPGV